MIQKVGDRDNPSISRSDIAFTIPANPMSDRGQLVYEETGKTQTHGGGEEEEE